MNPVRKNATTLRVGRNSAWLLFGEVFGRAGGAVWQLLLARYLGVLIFGEFTFALSVAAIIGVLSDFGLGTLVTREVSRNRAEPFRVLKGALLARALLALLLGTLAVVAVTLLGRPMRVPGLVAILAAGQLVMGQGELLAAAHRGREHMRRPVVLSLLYRFGLIATGVTAMALSASVEVLAGLMACWSLVLLLLLGGLPGGGAPLAAFALLRRAAPIGLGLVLWTIYFRTNILLVSFLRGDEEAGFFAAPFRLVEAVLLLSGPMLAAAFPVLARRIPEDPTFRDVFRGIKRTLIFLGAPLAVLFAMEGEEMLVLLLGPEYRPGAGALMVLAGTIPISFAASPFLAGMIARNRERRYLGIMAAGVVVNLAMAVILIPRFGATGAGIAMLVTEATIFSLALFLANLTTEVRHTFILLGRAAAAAGAAAGLLYLLKDAGLPFPYRQLLALLVAYPIMAMTLGVIHPARILLFFRTLSGRE